MGKEDKGKKKKENVVGEETAYDCGGIHGFARNKDGIFLFASSGIEAELRGEACESKM